VGACNVWSEAGPEKREEIWEAHRQYTLEFYRFLTTDPAVPEHLREELAEFGLCRDEFPEIGHWSPQLYVREGRRMQGIYVLSQKDILEESEKDDPIAISSFPVDSHDCQRVALPNGEGVVNEGTIFPVRMPGRRHGYPYQVPYRALLPKAEECDNLLVPVALSSTHVAFSSIRVEPTWMILGQSAGIAAALSAKLDSKTQALPYPTLRERLLAQGQVLEMPELPELPPEPVSKKGIDPKSLDGLVLDDTEAELKGAWDRSSNFPNFIGSGYVHDGKRADGRSIATFKFKAPKSGRYQLRCAYSAHETRATAVPVVVSSGGQETKLQIDQTKPHPVGEAFSVIGTVTLSGESESTLTVTNEGTDGFVILDAFQLLPLD
ncbi:MAG: FAD-dependent oxidoreductase, partial [Verrucomicrobiae bacterium]|nr:FAD-dependent oxidoreductase [Verrucomicrobiae bacterium]